MERITAENVVAVLEKALRTHAQNNSDIQYLWDYYRGKTPILNKTKEVRETINHKICVNRANEIVTFKLGYGFGEPIQYIRRGQDEGLTDDINALNEFMFQENKQAEDNELAQWLYVAGLGMRMALPGADKEEPFKIYTLDPRYSFVVRYNGLGTPVVMGVKYITKEDTTSVYSVYTADRYFEIENNAIVKNEPHVSDLSRSWRLEPIAGILLFVWPRDWKKEPCFIRLKSMMSKKTLPVHGWRILLMRIR